MTSYYNRVYGNLYPGKIAKSEDINLIQTNIEDAIKAVINDLHEQTSYILGGEEDAFLLSPAPKRAGRYIDTMNLVSESKEKWLNINKYGYKQGIKKSKTSLYSIIVKLRNLYNRTVTVKFELQDDKGTVLGTSNVKVPANTTSSEFEVVFAQDYIPTILGRSNSDIEEENNFLMSNRPNEEYIHEGDTVYNEQDDKNSSVGATQLYLVVKPLNMSATDLFVNGDEDVGVIDNETFMICADSEGKYGKLLQQTGNSGLYYEDTIYDLYFKDVYSTKNTYLCNGGAAVIDGTPVQCIDTHVAVDGASTFGDVKSFVYMDLDGHLRSENSVATEGSIDDVITPLPAGRLPIAEITFYKDGTDAPEIYQDDTALITRPRSHHERLRRLEKEMAYQRDITIPPRLKYTLSGSDIVEDNPQKITAKGDEDGTAGANELESGTDFFLTTDANGNFIVKTVNAEVLNIPITFDEEEDAKETDVNIKEGKLYPTKVNVDVKDKALTLKQLNSAAGVGMDDETAKETTFNVWDDDAANRPVNEDITPTEREFTVHKGKSGKNDWSSEYPAMTFYTDSDFQVSGINIPITKFKNCESVCFYIWKRQGPNNKTNKVWIELPHIYKSKSFSLANAKEKDGYQIVEGGFNIVVGKDKSTTSTDTTGTSSTDSGDATQSNEQTDYTDSGLHLPKGQYIIMALPTPKSGSGSVYVETYKPADSKDFLIRYYGAADASHFYLKDRYFEIWYNSATFTGTSGKYAQTGYIESGTLKWTQVEPVETVTVQANVENPEGCSYNIYADTGGGYKQLKMNEPTKITGQGYAFRWKISMTGTGKDTPRFFYSEENDYAVKFILTRRTPEVGAYDDKNACITTKTIYANDILRKYVGDDNMSLTDNRFSNYEFCRIWGQDSTDTDLLIDIAASDLKAKIDTPEITTATDTIPAQTNEFDIFSLYFVDLDLDDFCDGSVDYDNYEPDMEYDEHNMRFKLDTDNAYNDDDIAVFHMSDFEYSIDDTPISVIKHTKTTVSVGEDNEATEEVDTISFAANTVIDSDKNILIGRYQNKSSYMDLTKYSGMKLSFDLDTVSTEGVTTDSNVAIKGLALYVSSALEEDVPTRINQELENKMVVADIDALPPTLDDITEETLIDFYTNKVIHAIKNVNGINYDTYWQYIKNNEGSYVLQRVYDLKPYSIFEIVDLSAGDDQEVYVSIDEDNEHFKYAKEIGLIALVDEDIFKVETSCILTLNKIRAVAQGYYTIFDGTDTLLPADPGERGEDNLYIINTHTDKNATRSCQLKLYYNRFKEIGKRIAYWNNESITRDFNFIGCQVAVNSWIPKNSLIMNLCRDENGLDPVVSMNFPTINYIHYEAASDSIKEIPLTGTKVDLTVESDNDESTEDSNSESTKPSLELKDNVFDDCIIQTGDLYKSAGTSDKYTVKILTTKKEPSKGVDVNFKLNGVSYKEKTNDDGEASISINLEEGTYPISTEYKGHTVKNNIYIGSSNIHQNKVKFTATITMLDEEEEVPEGIVQILCDGNVIRSEEVNFATSDVDRTTKTITFESYRLEYGIHEIKAEYYPTIDYMDKEESKKYKNSSSSTVKVNVIWQTKVTTASSLSPSDDKEEEEDKKETEEKSSKATSSSSSSEKDNEKDEDKKDDEEKEEEKEEVIEQRYLYLDDDSISIVEDSEVENNEKLQQAIPDFVVVEDGIVNFSQVYRKLNTDETIKSISLETTEKFRDFMRTIHGEVEEVEDMKKTLNVYIKNIMLYEAETMPIFHPNIRMKIYNKPRGEETLDSPGVRKIGAVLTYR